MGSPLPACASQMLRQKGGESQPGVKLFPKAYPGGRLSSFRVLSFARKISESLMVLQPARNLLANIANEGLGILSLPIMSREKHAS